MQCHIQPPPKKGNACVYILHAYIIYAVQACVYIGNSKSEPLYWYFFLKKMQITLNAIQFGETFWW